MVTMQLPAAMVRMPARDSRTRPYWRLGNRLQALRKRAGLTQEELAAAAKLSTGYPGRFERGTIRPHADVLKAIADALELNDRELLELHVLAEYLPESVLGGVPLPEPDETAMQRILARLDSLEQQFRDAVSHVEPQPPTQEPRRRTARHQQQDEPGVEPPAPAG